MLCLWNISSAQSNFSIDQMLSAPFPSGLIAAPIGNQVAWVSNKEGVRNIWIAQGAQGKAITNYREDDGQGINSLTFTPDAQHIIYVHGGAPNRKGEIPNPTSDADGAKQAIWIISAKGGTARMLSEGSAPSISPDGKTLAFLKRGKVWTIGLEEEAKAKQLFSIRGRASHLSWAADGQRLAFVSNRGTHSYVGIYHFATDQLNYLNPSVDRDHNPVWGPYSKRVAFMRMPNEGQILPFSARRSGLPWSVMVADVETGKVNTVWKAKEGKGSVFRAISAHSQLFWGANDRLVFPWERDGWTHLYSVNTSGTQVRLLTPGEFEVQFVSMSTDGTSMLYSSNQNDIDRQHIWRVDIKGGKAEQLTHGVGAEWAPIEVAPNGSIVCLASGPVTPAHVVRLSPSGKMKPLVKANPFPSEQLRAPEQVIFAAADGMEIHGQLFLPKNHRSSQKHPALLFFHGGSRRQMLLSYHHRGYYHNAYALNQYLASQGYIVLSINYRSGIGYGMEFREALNYGAQGASEYNDVIGAGLYLQSRDDVDADRIGLWGGSYGGYLTALGLAKASDLFAAGVDIHGVHDWNVVIRNFVPSYQPAKRAKFAQLAFDSSPMAFVDGWRSPVLLIHGDDDRNVPFSETVDIVEALRRRNVYVEQLIFPDEVHGFLLHKNWLAAYRATEDFFDRMLKSDGVMVKGR